jgi:hypothetical protein
MTAQRLRSDHIRMSFRLASAQQAVLEVKLFGWAVTIAIPAAGLYYVKPRVFSIFEMLASTGFSLVTRK